MLKREENEKATERKRVTAAELAKPQRFRGKSEKGKQHSHPKADRGSKGVNLKPKVPSSL